MYLESKKIATLMIEKKSQEDIKKAVVEQNILQLPSAARRISAVNTIITRLKSLDRYLLSQFVNADRETSKLILLYAVMINDQLFKVFMRQVYLVKILSAGRSLTKKEILKFFSDEATQSSTLAKWTSGTRSRLASAYLQVLRNSGLLRNRQLVRGVLAPEVSHYLAQHGDRMLYEILIGKRVTDSHD